MCKINYEELKISNHAEFRYALRIKKESHLLNQNSFNAWSKLDPQIASKYKVELLEDLKESEFLIQAIFCDEGVQNNYFINKDKMIIFALDTNNKSLITCFKVDYGFGDKVNKITMKELLKEMDSLNKDKNKLQEKESDTQDINRNKINTIDDEIKLLKSKIGILESQKEIIEVECGNYTKKVENYRSEIILKSKQIAHSIGVKFDIELKGVN